MSEVVDIDLIISKLLEGGCRFTLLRNEKKKKNGFISAQQNGQWMKLVEEKEGRKKKISDDNWYESNIINRSFFSLV